MKPVAILFITTAIFLNGCSNRDIYQSMQSGKQNDCLSLPEPQQDDCLHQAQKSFDEYNQEREELLKEKE